MLRKQYLYRQIDLLVLCAVVLLSGASAVHGAPATDGLTWMPDPAFVVSSGLSDSVVMSRTEALAILNRINSGEVENFGRTDWRLPTERELDARLERGLPPAGEESPNRLLRKPGLTLRASVPAGKVMLWPVAGAAIEPGFSETVILATNSVRVKNDADVASGDVVANDASAGPTLADGYELSMDPKSSTAAGWAVKADSLQVKKKATIGGDAHSNDADLKGTVAGTEVSPLALPVFAMLPPFYGASPGASGVAVPEDGFATLPAGAYAAVTVGDGGTLLFEGGEYDVASITAGQGAALLFAGPSEVRVAGRFLTGKSATVGPDGGSGVGANEIVFYVAGIDGSDGTLLSTPLAAEIGHSNAVGANVYAPNGTVRIGHFSDATGAFVARDVLVENGAVVTLASFFVNEPPEAADDSLTVDEGGSQTVLDSGETSLLANDSDPNGDNLSVSPSPVSGPANGSVVLNADGTFEYTHDGSETTSDSFVYEVCDDGAPSFCDTATVTVTVVPVNDPPTAVADSATVEKGETVTVLDSGETSLLANDSDPEGDSLFATTALVVNPQDGAAIVNSDGTFSYENFSIRGLTTDSFTYRVCDDGDPTACSTAVVTIAIEDRPTLRVSRSGLGSGQVTSSPAGINCGTTCLAEYAASTVVTLTATPAAGSVFGGWSGTDADCADGVVTLDGNIQCNARFDLDVPPAIVTVSLAGAGSGTVTSSPSGISCPGTCSAGYPNPTRVTLTATPAAGSVFAGWSGAADCADGDLFVTGDVACTATFEVAPPPDPTFELTVLFFGSGSASVASSPAGISCDGDCSADFDENTVVTLSARPSSGSSVTWGGDCSGTGFFTSVTMDADKTCTVTID